MKSKNLKLIVAIEIGLIVCLCLCGIGGIAYYSGNLPATEAGGQPPTQPVAEATATPQPTETPIPVLLGTELEPLPDGASKFTDLDGGFEMDIPAGWLAVRADNNDEINAALVGEGAKNQMLFDHSYNFCTTYPHPAPLPKGEGNGYKKRIFMPKTTISSEISPLSHRDCEARRRQGVGG